MSANASEDEVTTGPLSWRDVYKAVGDSEARIVAAIEKAVEPIVSDIADHEARLRHLETDGSFTAHEGLRIATSVESRMTILESKVDEMDDAVNVNSAFRGGGFAALGLGQKIIIGIISILGGLAVFLDIVSKYTGGT